MAMYFHCSACGGEHLSKIQMPRSTFESPTTVIRKSSEPCPATGRVVSINKPEIYWKDTARIPA